MKLMDIIRSRFLPPENVNAIYGNCQNVSKYGVEKYGFGFASFLSFKDTDIKYYAQQDKDDTGFADLDKKDAYCDDLFEKGYFETIEDAKEQCWDHFEEYYSNNIIA